jgi:hypothetical protein
MDQKIQIVMNQPKVMISYSKPFPIALVEDKTNIVCTKASLFIHLFQTYSAHCIVCNICHVYMSIADFSKHFHASDDDDEDDSKTDDSESSSDTDSENSTTLEGKNTKKKKKKLKTYKILPYRNNAEELSSEDIKTWKIFGKRFNFF